MFQLSQEEASGLIFQFGISKGRGGRRHFPYAFTEQGVAMLSSVLRSPRAAQVAQEQNLKLLGEAIGIDLELESQEKDVGPFRADILCKDTATDEWVLIENQLERTDHSHLGQLLTYAAGLNAVTIVWIAERFRYFAGSQLRGGIVA